MNKFYSYYDFPEGIDEVWLKLYDLSCSYQKAINTLLTKEHLDFSRELLIKSERDIFPILALLHLYLELILKALISQEDKELIKSHDLKKLRKKVNEKHLSFKLGKEGEELLNFLHMENTDKADSFRYNFDNEGNEKFVLTASEKEIIEKGVDYDFVLKGFQEITSNTNTYFKKLISERKLD